MCEVVQNKNEWPEGQGLGHDKQLTKERNKMKNSDESRRRELGSPRRGGWLQQAHSTTPCSALAPRSRALANAEQSVDVF